MYKTIFDLISAQGGLGNVNVNYLPDDPNTSQPQQISRSYYLHELSIKGKLGVWYSMVEIFQSMEIYEDIFTNSIHGSVMVDDMAGGLSKFMLTGGEQIKITASKAIQDTTLIIAREDLIVYQISEVEVKDQKLMRYRLNFTTKAFLNSEKKRIYRVYKNERRISELVRKIYATVGSGTTLLTDLDDSISRVNKNYLSPGYTPFESIDFLCKRAGTNDYCMFFERLNSLAGSNHVLTSMKKLYNRGYGSATKVYYNIAPEHYTPASSDIRAYAVNFQDSYNHIQNMRSGFYNSNIKTIDLCTRRVVNTPVNYMGMEADKTNKFINTSNFFAQYNTAFPEIPGERIITNPYNDASYNKASWLKYDTYGSTLLSNFRITIDIPGNNNLGVGEYVDLKIPSIEAYSLNIGSGLVTNDPVFSAKYMITAVKHTFTLSEYSKKVELSKYNVNINYDQIINDVGVGYDGPRGNDGGSSGGGESRGNF